MKNCLGTLTCIALILKKHQQKYVHCLPNVNSPLNINAVNEWLFEELTGTIAEVEQKDGGKHKTAVNLKVTGEKCKNKQPEINNNSGRPRCFKTLTLSVPEGQIWFTVSDDFHVKEFNSVF